MQNDLGDYFANMLWGGGSAPPDVAMPPPKMAAAQIDLPERPTMPPPQMVVPQAQLESVVPNMPPQVSGNVSVPMALGELFASARYQPTPAQNPKDFGFGFGFRKRF